jgi:hypothetical protein
MSAVSDLSSSINIRGSYCLNAASDAPFTNLLTFEESKVLRSDADEQLILQLELQGNFSLSQLWLRIPSDDSCPRTICAYINRPNIGFGDVEDIAPTEEFVVRPNSSNNTVKLTLNQFKWRNTFSITLFVKDNHGAEQTVLQGLNLFGKPVDGIDVVNNKFEWNASISKPGKG